MPVIPFQWTCPFCGHHQVVTDENFQSDFQVFEIGKTQFSDVGLSYRAIRCVNPDCNNISLDAAFEVAEFSSRTQDWHGKSLLQQWRLLPESSSNVQPDYIPAPLREDYYEACQIRDKSPKAAATLARRCLQGMIRDFCGISKARLIEEIKELKRLIDEGKAPKGVEAETIDAIDAIRDIGNIGAHMERDINLIIDVDPGEAQALIDLIEMLFEEWYVARHKREQRLAGLLAIAAEKKAAIEQGRARIAEAKLAAVTDESSG